MHVLACLLACWWVKGYCQSPGCWHMWYLVKAYQDTYLLVRDQSCAKPSLLLAQAHPHNALHFSSWCIWRHCGQLFRPIARILRRGITWMSDLYRGGLPWTHSHSVTATWTAGILNNSETSGPLLNGRILKMYSLEVYIKPFGGQNGGSSEPPRTSPAYGPVIGVSLSELHTSRLHYAHACVCLLACLWPYTVKFKWPHLYEDWTLEKHIEIQP